MTTKLNIMLKDVYYFSWKPEDDRKVVKDNLRQFLLFLQDHDVDIFEFWEVNDSKILDDDYVNNMYHQMQERNEPVVFNDFDSLCGSNDTVDGWELYLLLNECLKKNLTAIPFITNSKNTLSIF